MTSNLLDYALILVGGFSPTMDFACHRRYFP
jgi:hypothetical protein